MAKRKRTDALDAEVAKFFKSKKGAAKKWDTFFGVNGPWFTCVLDRKEDEYLECKECLESEDGAWDELMNGARESTAKWLQSGMKFASENSIERMVIVLTFAEASFSNWEILVDEELNRLEDSEDDELIETWDRRLEYVNDDNSGLTLVLNEEWKDSPEELETFLQQLTDDYP